MLPLVVAVAPCRISFKARSGNASVSVLRSEQNGQRCSKDLHKNLQACCRCIRSVMAGFVHAESKIVCPEPD